MSENIFDSSDSCRSAQPLTYARSVTFDKPLALKLGGELDGVKVVFETYGKLNDRKDNAVLICHALSGDSHVASHDADDEPGWWELGVGPGKYIDTDKYFVICPNVLGGCRGTTGPNSLNPATDKPYGRDFPTVTVDDMVRVQKRVVDHLGIDKLLAVIGGSMGGHHALHWGAKFSDRTRSVMPVATSPRLTSQALAFDVVARNAILQDRDFQDGQYYESVTGPVVGLAIARMLGHITYLSHEAMQDKFESDRHQPRDVATAFEKKFSVGSYLAYQSERFVERFDANSYLTLSMAMDLFDLGTTDQELRDTLSGSLCRWLIVSFSSDWLFPPYQSKQIVDALIDCGKHVSYCDIESDCGHDAFLLEADAERYGSLVRGFLENQRLDDDRDAMAGQSEPSTEKRLDYDLIVELSKPAHSILDLGCGEGELLCRLRQRGHESLLGVELDEGKVVACVERGLDVVQGDLDDPLDYFADEQFDFVVLSLTLQAIKDVEGVVNSMLRIGRRAIVTFPNFGYFKLRNMLIVDGRAPLAAGVLKHEWYNTPNIRFLTIKDFEQFCQDRQIKVSRKLMIDSEAGAEVYDDPNLNADLAIFVISK